MFTQKETEHNYRNFEDWKIKELANEAGTLRKEIIPILNDEIKRRNLGDHLLTWVSLESDKFVGLERQNLIKRIRKEKCSECLEYSMLEGYKFKTLISYVIGSDLKIENLIICKSCANSKRNDSITKTLLLGWWSKKGLLFTPVEVISTLIRILRHKQEDKEIIDFFIDNRTGKIRQSLENNSLFSSIKRFNTINTVIDTE